MLSYFERVDLLRHIIIIGSWAEYFYSYLGIIDVHSSVVTRDVDILYPDIYQPRRSINIHRDFYEMGYLYDEDILTEIVRFTKQNIIDVEFITLNKGRELIAQKIPSLDINAMALRDLEYLVKYSFLILFRNLEFKIPEPAAFLVHKLLILEKRTELKRVKDIRSIKNLLNILQRYPHQLQLLKLITHQLTKKQTIHFKGALEKYQFYDLKNFLYEDT